MAKSKEYTIAIADAIMSLFRDEEHGGSKNYNYKINEVDATVFFTSMVSGCNLVFNKMTNVEKDNLQFTYLLNQLVVQDALERAKHE